MRRCQPRGNVMLAATGPAPSPVVAPVRAAGTGCRRRGSPRTSRAAIESLRVDVRPCGPAWHLVMPGARGDRSVACRPVDRPIGMFDSGFGGLTVARAVIDVLPGRGPGLRRRHRPLPVRAAATGRGAGVRPRAGVEPGQGLRRQGGDRGLQHRGRGRARRSGRGAARARPGGDRTRCPGARAGHPIRSGGRDRHGRHHLVRGLRAGRRRTPERRSSSRRPPVRASSSSSSAARPRASR